MDDHFDICCVFEISKFDIVRLTCIFLFQFFLSKRAVYLLLWSMRQGYEHAGLDFWLSSISCHAPNTPILVIGTQCDLVS